MQLDGRTVLVSGGASGLGAATADMIVAAGGRVVIADIGESTGRAHAQHLGNAAEFVRTDVTRSDDVERCVDSAVQRFGAIHGVVCAAGVGTAERVLGKEGVQPLEHFTRVIDINLVGTFNVLRLAAVAMIDNEPLDGDRGLVIMTASVAAFDGQIGQAAYAASKGGVASLTLTAARDLADKAIRVMTIAPGVMETPMMAGLPGETKSILEALVPHPARLGRPEEYAMLVCSIIENSLLNGEVIRLDGALRMPPR